MTIEQAISSASQLPPQDRILVAQAIWDGLADDASQSISPEMQAELDRRWELYLADKSSALTLAEFKRRIKNAREKK